MVGYGASPNQTIELVRAMASIHVRGNHDRCCCGLEDISDFNPVAAEAALWTRGQLSDRNLDWLSGLPMGPLQNASWQGVQFVHGSPLGEDEYIHSEFSASAALEVSPFHLTFFGHTHIQGAFTRPHRLAEVAPLEPVNSAGHARVLRLKLNPARKYLVNPGSVGQPRDRDRRAAFALYDSRKQEVRFYRVPYDIKRAQERILQAGLPEVLALRLEDGR